MRMPRAFPVFCLALIISWTTPALAQRTGEQRAEGFRLYEEGRYREAIPYLDAVLSRKHRDIEAAIKRGNAYLRLNQPEKAIADFDNMIRIFPFFPASYTDRGIANIMLGQLEAAKDDFRKAIALYGRPLGPYIPFGSSDPNSSWNLSGYFQPVYFDRNGTYRALAYCGLGQVYHREGDDGRAIIEYNQAIRWNRRDPNNYAGRGDAFASLGQLDAALADFDE